MGHAIRGCLPQRDADVPDELRNERVDREQSRRQGPQGSLQLPCDNVPAFIRSCNIQTPQSHSSNGSTRLNELLWSLQKLETAENTSLLNMLGLCAQDGSSLSMDWKLCRVPQLQSILPLLLLLSLYWTSLRLLHDIV